MQLSPPGPPPSPDAAAARGGGTPTLGQAVGVVGPDVVEVLRAPCGTDVPVSGAGVFDEGETLQARGRILIAPGVDTSAPGAAGVLRAADRAGAAALVLRRGTQGIAPSLAEAADEVSTALLARAPWIEWGELMGLLRAAVVRTGTAVPEASAEVPLGDLPGLALTLAALVGGAITVEDPESNVLAYSPTADTADPLRRLTILGRRVPSWRVAELAESGFLTMLWASGDVVHRPADGRFPERLAVAVRAGDEILGSLWAAADGEPLPPGARDALRQAAAIAVPHLLHHRLRSRSAAGRRRYAVRALFEERPPDVPAAAAVLGVEAGQPCTVLTAAAAEPVAPDELDRAFHLASLRLAAHHTPAFAHRDGERLDVLLASTGAGDGADRLARDLAAVLRGAGVRPFVAVGHAVGGLGDAAASRAGAAEVLRVLRERGGPETAGAEDVRFAMDALRVTEAVAEHVPSAADAVAALLAHDERHGTDLPRTVAAHLVFFGDAAATARYVGVHTNTLRYRLRRAAELCGIDLTDPDVRLLVELGLRRAGLIPLP
ncbi:helix-turn-helix domain-containing protein [Streptomyces sp. NPDC048641]|uniref:PucR family transcriptional regulator n=1 Tax=Streptomyces sp. NPDC048641 TaxID=3154825 RepID=UPI00342EA1D7